MKNVAMIHLANLGVMVRTKIFLSKKERESIEFVLKLTDVLLATVAEARNSNLEWEMAQASMVVRYFLEKEKQ